MLNVVLLGFEEVGDVVVNADRGDLISLADLIDDVLAVRYLTKYRVLTIEVGSGYVGDEKLRTVGAGAGVGHREYAGRAVAQIGMKFVGEFVAGATTSGTSGVAALDHEICDHAVEGDAIVIAALGEIEEVRAGHRHL